MVMTEPYRISCAVCGRACSWREPQPDSDPPHKFGGWYCKRCDAFTETDVELD